MQWYSYDSCYSARFVEFREKQRKTKVNVKHSSSDISISYLHSQLFYHHHHQMKLRCTCMRCVQTFLIEFNNKIFIYVAWPLHSTDTRMTLNLGQNLNSNIINRYLPEKSVYQKISLCLYAFLVILVVLQTYKYHHHTNMCNCTSYVDT